MATFENCEIFSTYYFPCFRGYKAALRSGNKFQAALTPPIMSDLFVTTENNFNLRNFQALKSLHKRTVKFGTETISYRGPQKWYLIPETLRAMETLNKFSKEIKKMEE